MKKNDIILLVCVVGVAALALLVLWVMLSGTGDVAVVTVNGEEYARLPLDEDTELVIETPNGTNILVIKDGNAYMTEADCPDKTCVKTGVADELRSIVCLPHKVTVSVEGGDER